MKSLVEKALQNYPETRDNDRKLMLVVWWYQNKEYNKNFKEFFLHDAIHPETIRRTRAKFQQEGKYPASKEVDEAKFNKFQQVKRDIVHAHAEETQQILL